jgi:hypothetical protein
MEVLVFGRIPRAAVVVTAPLGAFLDCLPDWCDALKPEIRDWVKWGAQHSTEMCCRALAALAKDPANTTPLKQAKLLAHSVDQSILMLGLQRGARAIPPQTVERAAHLAALFCWWPKWITEVDDAEYGYLLRQVDFAVRQRLPKIAAEQLVHLHNCDRNPALATDRIQ